MTTEKFTGEIQTLKKFFQIYCNDKKHENIKCQKKSVKYKNNQYDYEFDLCDDCFKLLEYSILKLENCPHDEKPRCRTCPTPCYEPDEWKRLAKLMKYSGMKLGLNKIKNLFKRKK